MMKRQWLGVLCLVVLRLGAVAAWADLGEVGCYVQGGTLAGSPDYEWWYGCSPTAAGMMMGYYDTKGYSNIVPGGAAEASSWAAGGSPLANTTIASSGHIEDFYVKGYGASHDDSHHSLHSFDCLADFMGTSQDNLPGPQGPITNPNGATTFWYLTNGAAFHYDQLGDYAASDGMYGIKEYVTYTGYDVADLYTQATDNLGLTYGFTFDDYKAEIDAGRVVMIQITGSDEGHSMFGYGYNDLEGLTQVILNDTWSSGPHIMDWGGSYSGMTIWGVTVLELSPVPVPAAVLLGVLGLGAAGLKLRKFV